MMNSDQTFMMIFRATPQPGYQPTAEELAQMSQDWGSFIGNIAIKEKLESTHQLGFQGTQIASDLSLTEGFLISEQQAVFGNMIVRANSLEEAVEMAKDCPILKAGGTVEVRSITPMN